MFLYITSFVLWACCCWTEQEWPGLWRLQKPGSLYTQQWAYGAPGWNLPCLPLPCTMQGRVSVMLPGAGSDSSTARITEDSWAVLFLYCSVNPICYLYFAELSWQALEERNLLITNICNAWPHCTLPSDVENSHVQCGRGLPLCLFEQFTSRAVCSSLRRLRKCWQGQENEVAWGPEAMQRKSQQKPVSFYYLFLSHRISSGDAIIYTV